MRPSLRIHGYAAAGRPLASGTNVAACPPVGSHALRAICSVMFTLSGVLGYCTTGEAVFAWID